jgi:EAL domain-containing protein (putative c-di-GMP-specific phosphodiesterase class I)
MPLARSIKWRIDALRATIAEFVSDDATIGLLREYGVDFAQGYHVGRPQPISELWVDACEGAGEALSTPG